MAMLDLQFPSVPYRRWIFVLQTPERSGIKALFDDWFEFAKSDLDTFRAASGGMMTCPQIVLAPDSRRFFSFTYNKDFDYWRSSMVNYCDQLGLPWAEITNGQFCVSGGSHFSCDQCSIELVELRSSKRRPQRKKG
jgi:hypothetical protein